MPDLDAIRPVARAATSDHAVATDIAASRVLPQAARVDIDHLEHEVFEAVHETGMNAEALAAVLDLSDARAALARRRWLKSRYALPSSRAGLAPLPCAI